MAKQPLQAKQTKAAQKIFTVPALAIIAALLAAFPGSSHADTVYVATGTSQIQMYDAATGANLGLFGAGTGLNDPDALAFDSAGDLFVANYGQGSGNTILKISPNGVGSVFASNNVFGPGSLAFDVAGNLYVGNNSGIIDKFTPGGVGSIFAALPIRSVQGLATDSAGNLYVSDGSTGNIDKFSPSGVSSVFAHVGSAYGVAFDSAGNLYAATFTGNTIDKITPGGVVSLFCNGGPFLFPTELAFDSSGTLYATDPGGNVDKITQGGVASLFTTTGPNPPFGIAIIPEPSVLGLLAVGAIAFIVFRRRCTIPWFSLAR
jgi:sugar lactone lactonase YvrE